MLKGVKEHNLLNYYETLSKIKKFYKLYFLVIWKTFSNSSSEQIKTAFSFHPSEVW